MEHLPVLPVWKCPLPGEALASLLRRTGAAMGYDNVNLLTRLLGETHKPHQNLNWTGPGPHSDRLAALLRLTPPDLLQGTVHRFAGALVLRPRGSPAASLCDKKTALRFFAARSSPVCPACLATDSEPYGRLLWGFRPLGVCTRHACVLLVRCPACGRNLLSARKDLAVCRCGMSLAQQSPAEVSRATLVCARTLEAWLQGEFGAVPQLSSAAGFWLAARLALAIGKTPEWVRRAAERFGIDLETSSELLRWTAAVEALQPWPARLYQFLDTYQQVPKNHRLHTGVDRAFGLFLREAVFLERLGYASPAEALRRYLLERYTGGHVNQKLGLFRKNECRQLLDRRLWYTGTEAADVLGLRSGAVSDLLEQGVLEGQIHVAGRRGRRIAVVRKASVEALQQSLDGGLDVTRARHRLGIGRSQVFALIGSGLLRAVRTRRGWVILPDSVQAIEAVYRELPQLGADRTAWLLLRQATRVYGPSGLNLARTLELVRAGRVAARRDGRYADLRGLWLSHCDLEAQVSALRAHKQQEDGYTLCQLGRVLLPNRPCRERLLRRWIGAGLLRAQRRERAWVVSREEVERFRAEYCLAEEACAILRVSRSTLSRWESLGGLRPVYGKKTTAGAGFSLYRRADLQRDLLCRRRRRVTPEHT